MNSTALSKLKNVPLKRLGYVVAYHLARAEDAGSAHDRKRHSQIAKEYRKAITTLFVERFNAGEYVEA